MTLANSAGDAFVLTLVVAVLARIAGALTTDGAIAGFVVGMCVSAGFGLPGLAVLGTFFVVGSIATRVGWERKKARGTAEAGEGRRDWKRVLGKGGVAAAIGLLVALECCPDDLGRVALVGAIAAALADTLGTEIGTLSAADPRLLPTLRPAPKGTPGAVSALGTFAGGIGAALVGAVWQWTFFGRLSFTGIALAVASGVAASLIESLAVSGLGLRAPGFVRNLLTTAVGGLLPVLLAFVLFSIGPFPAPMTR